MILDLSSEDITTNRYKEKTTKIVKNNMVNQDDILDFFRQLSWKLNQEGYPILDNLKYDFPGIPTYEEVMEDIEENQEIEEMVKTEE